MKHAHARHLAKGNMEMPRDEWMQQDVHGFVGVDVLMLNKTCSGHVPM